jgi:hypothetical protein
MLGSAEALDFGDIVLLGVTPLRSGRNGVAIFLGLLDSIYSFRSKRLKKSKLKL